MCASGDAADVRSCADVVREPCRQQRLHRRAHRLDRGRVTQARAHSRRPSSTVGSRRRATNRTAAAANSTSCAPTSLDNCRLHRRRVSAATRGGLRSLCRHSKEGVGHSPRRRRRRGRPSVARVSRQQDAHLLSLLHDAGEHRRHGRRLSAAAATSSSAESNRAIAVRFFIVGKMISSSPRLPRSSASCGRIQMFAIASRSSCSATCASGARGDEEPRVVAAGRPLGSDPVAEVVDAVDGELEVLLGAHLDQPSLLLVDRGAVPDEPLLDRRVVEPHDRSGSSRTASSSPDSSKHSRTAATQYASPPLSDVEPRRSRRHRCVRCSTDRGPRGGRARRPRRPGTRRPRRRSRSSGCAAA